MGHDGRVGQRQVGWQLQLGQSFSDFRCRGGILVGMALVLQPMETSASRLGRESGLREHSSSRVPDRTKRRERASSSICCQRVEEKSVYLGCCCWVCFCFCAFWFFSCC